MRTGRPRITSSNLVLATIKSYHDEHGISPTLNEIGKALGISTRTVYRRVVELEKCGRLRRWKGARGMSVVEAGRNNGVEIDRSGQ